MPTISTDEAEQARRYREIVGVMEAMEEDILYIYEFGERVYDLLYEWRIEDKAE